MFCILGWFNKPANNFDWEVSFVVDFVSVNALCLFVRFGRPHFVEDLPYISGAGFSEHASHIPPYRVMGGPYRGRGMFLYRY